MKKNILIYILCILSQGLVFSQKIELKITGKDSIETKIIDSLSYSIKHIDYKSITKEVDSLQNRLFNIGYIENKKTSIKKKNDSLFTAQFFLNRKYDTIYIYHQKTKINKALLGSISNHITDNYFTIPFNRITETVELLNSEIANKGKPFSKLKLKNIITEDNIIVADLEIESDINTRHINDITIKGYEKFPKSFLKHYLKLKKGSLLNTEDINKKTEALNNLSFTSESNPPEILFTQDSTTLYLYLKKEPANSFDGFLGFGTNEETSKIEFDGYLNLKLINNLNFGESFSLLYKSDENEQRTFDVKANLPYLFKSPLGLEAQLNIFRKDSTFNITNQTLNLFYQLSQHQKIYGGIHLAQSSDLLENNTLTNINDYESFFYQLKYEYIKLDTESLLFPTTFDFNLQAGFGNRETKTQDEQQYSLDIYTSKILTLNKSNSIFLRLQGAYLISDEYLENELRRFGGINSIRGFQENSIFATLHTTLNTEYRYQLGQNLYIHSIIDASYFENQTTNTKEKLFGFGFGFGLLTKSGLLKFNYANGKINNQKFKLSDSKIHISLSTFF